MKKKNLLFVCTSMFALALIGQVPKTIVVEHFTNSVCGICANKNPGFYTNLNNQSNVIHLSVHPSSPYSSCLINKHHTSENDARTNYYGIYGGTPRLVIQGTVISSSANYGSSSIFTPFQNQTSPASIRIEQRKYGNDSIRSTIIIKTEEAHSLGNLKLFAALAEDTLFYNSPNGESKHYDVFRKSYTGTSGINVVLPPTVGDSLVYSYVSTVNNAWVFSRIFTLVILQDASTKAVVQASAVPAKQNDVTTSVVSINNSLKDIVVYPNPATDQLFVSLTNKQNVTYSIFDMVGKQLMSGSLQSQQIINIAYLPSGSYLLEINEEGNKLLKKINKR